MTYFNPFGAFLTFDTYAGKSKIYSLKVLEQKGIIKNLSTLPFTIKILIENVLRNIDGKVVTEDDLINIANWQPKSNERKELPFLPARVILQDFTGVPAVVDLASMREAVKQLGGNPTRINPIINVDLVIDHSMQVDYFGTILAPSLNTEKEFERNKERYAFLRWAQKEFKNFRVVPPNTGIIHQVNLEYLASVVQLKEKNGEFVAFPDTLVGTDSHTTMINGLGVLGWGVGGIEAEANILGQPLYILAPDVIGFELKGELKEGVTATDIVLTITQILRKKGVVGKFVEFYGKGLSSLSLADRATIANMSPEYGATVGFFPVDNETIEYLRLSGRKKELIELVYKYCNEQGLFRTEDTPSPTYSDTLELDLSEVEPTLAGPKRPHDRVPLKQVKESYIKSIEVLKKDISQDLDKNDQLKNGSVVIASITSCTNTSNPEVMIGAGILAKKAVERGLQVKPWVKTSLAPGSKVVTQYLKKSGLLPYLEALKFHVVGYGCATCIGNSGPISEKISKVIKENDLVVVSVLSGNRNFEGRVHPLTRFNYLASPPLVVAYAIAGRIDIDFDKEPIGFDPNNFPVFLKDIWPSSQEVKEAVKTNVTSSMFEEEYRDVFQGGELWNSISTPEGALYKWDADSTYIQEAPFFKNLSKEPTPLQDIKSARVLALLGDTITTDHISPAGNIPVSYPAGKYLISIGVKPEDFNSYGARRGNHNVMIRGTFGNIRLKNLLVNKEGSFTIYHPTNEEMWIYDASILYQEKGIPLLIIAGKEYGAGSSRDWAAKGTYLLGIKAVIAESFERIHRSNLVGMGVLPLEFKQGENAQSLGLTGREIYDIEGISNNLKPRQELTVKVTSQDGDKKEFKVIARLDTPVEVEYYVNGGILQTVLRQMNRE